LRSSLRGSFHYLYMVVDVWSRKIVGYELHAEESSEHAAQLFLAACAREGIRREQVTLHMDNGPPMKGATLQATLDALGVSTSFSRPRVSNDNPFSEALFRTLKYRPAYPRFFDSIDDARRWVQEFVDWYNPVHCHSAIRYVTPEERHTGREVEILSKREKLYREARRRNPSRCSGAERNWNPILEVTLNPEDSPVTSVA